MHPQVITKTLGAASANAIALNQALAGAGNFNLNGALVAGGVATLDTQRRVLISSAGNDSGITFTVFGAGQNGQAISEKVVGSNGGAVATLQDFLTVTRVSASGATAGNVQIGTNTIGSTPWIPISWFLMPAEFGFTGVVLSGAPNYTVEYTQEPVFPPLAPYQPGFDQTPPVPTPFAVPSMQNKVANASGNLAQMTIVAWRGTLNAAGSVRFTGIQSGLIQG